MSERNLEFEKALLGWLSHSERGLREFKALHIPKVYETRAAGRYIDLLLKHGAGSAGQRLKELSYSGALDPQEADNAVRWSQDNPKVDDGYMLETTRCYLRQRCQAVYAEQLTLASDVWDDNLQKAAEKELHERLARLADDKKEENGFTVQGLIAAFSSENRENLFELPGYAGKLFRNRLRRGDLVTFQAQPKVGKSAMLVRCGVAAMRYGRRLLYISIGDMSEGDVATRILACESQRNSLPYEPDDCIAVPCCAKAFVGCLKECYRTGGYSPMNPPLAAQYLEETEVSAILQAFPSFKPCTLCRGTLDYKPSVWWRLPEDNLIDLDAAMEIFGEIQRCGEYGPVEALFKPARQVTVSTLDDMLNERRRRKEAVDVLVIDYADLTGIDTKHSKWEGLQYMWEELRALAKKQNCLVLTATQGNRTGGDMTTQSTTTVAGTRASVDNCTALISINQTPAEKSHRVLRLSVLAARSGSFAQEHQAMCISRMDIQDPIYDSWHKWVKTDKRKE